MTIHTKKLSLLLPLLLSGCATKGYMGDKNVPEDQLSTISTRDFTLEKIELMPSSKTIGTRLRWLEKNRVLPGKQTIGWRGMVSRVPKGYYATNCNPNYYIPPAPSYSGSSSATGYVYYGPSQYANTPCAYPPPIEQTCTLTFNATASAHYDAFIEDDVLKLSQGNNQPVLV